ncbi:ankyrin repeat-containing domain protein [Apodospora peruviana]|uniref:Ankyrin repeat-containing domain protein n=1 Tax=Apodospora peruviana TaxID=516989 RepID=A0AAE0M2J8_9PEZI|nr:ankyrin repeat-containing domain protein [Apodospora peruviana]
MLGISVTPETYEVTLVFTFNTPDHGEQRNSVAQVVMPVPTASGLTQNMDDPHVPVTIPCRHIRLGDILILQGRPCQVIRISTSNTTGQNRYLGLDVFTKQLYEESSFVTQRAPSMVIQTMLGPRLKQYRVLELQDEHLLAMTETGDIIKNVPILDQSLLLSRVRKALDSRLGSVRVLVVSDQEHEMAVDMKVVCGSRPIDGPPSAGEGKGVDDDGKTELHQACRTGNQALLHSVLEHTKNVNLKDNEGRTALFDATECRFQLGVRTLLAHAIPIDVNAMDAYQNTALDMALRTNDLTSQSIAVLLLENGASPVAGFELGVQNLLAAAAEGNAGAVAELIINGIDIWGRRQRNSALWGNTILHAAVDRDSLYTNFYKEVTGRHTPPRLFDGHVAVVKLLLQHRAVASLRRFIDGLTVQDLILRQLEPGKPGAEQEILEEILQALISPPTAYYRQIVADEFTADFPVTEPLRPVNVDDAKRKTFDNLKLRLQYHDLNSFTYREPGVGSFIYPNGKGEAKRCIQELNTWVAQGERTASWTWVHLPANNKAWAKDSLRILKSKLGLELGGSTKEIEAFVEESYYEIRGAAPYARFRRPLLTRSVLSGSECCSLVIPYIDTESLDEYIHRIEKPVKATFGGKSS